MTKRRKSINGKRVTISDPKVTIDALKVLKSKKPIFLFGDTLLLPANKKSNPLLHLRKLSLALSSRRHVLYVAVRLLLCWNVVYL